MESERDLFWAIPLPGEVLSIRDHLRLRLRPAGLEPPEHPWGTDSRSQRADRDLANLSAYRYQYRSDGYLGTVAILEFSDSKAPIYVAETLELAEAHAASEHRFGYTSLPSPRLAAFEWHHGHDSVQVRVRADGDDVVGSLVGLGPARQLLGSHPRDPSISYSGSMREAGSATLVRSGQPIIGETFMHLGYAPWIGRPASSGAIQQAETFVDRARPIPRSPSARPRKTTEDDPDGRDVGGRGAR